MGIAERIITARTPTIGGLKVGVGLAILFGPVYAATAWAHGPFTGAAEMTSAWIWCIPTGTLVWSIPWIPLGLALVQFLDSERAIQRILIGLVSAYPFMCMWSYASVCAKTGAVLPMVVGSARPQWFDWRLIELTGRYGWLAAGVAALTGIALAGRLWTTTPPNTCAACGYDLRGVRSDRCPECGARGGTENED